MDTQQPTGNVRKPTIRPFKPDITGTLRSRLFKYAKETGRSASGAVRFILAKGLKQENY